MKIFFVFAMAVFLGAAAHAEDKSSGCGIGWAVTKKKSIVASSSRMTTNNIFFIQWFGMSSGTAGCRQHSIVKKEKEQIYFAESNYNNLLVEMAEGRGEYLAAFASVMGCGSETVPEFSRFIQGAYPEIFNGTNDSPGLMLERVRAKMRNETSLAANCQIG